MEQQNAAMQILAYLNVYGAMLGTRVKYRGPTPKRTMRKGEDGMRRPGAYGKGLRNWCNRQPSKGRI